MPIGIVFGRIAISFGVSFCQFLASLSSMFIAVLRLIILPSSGRFTFYHAHGQPPFTADKLVFRLCAMTFLSGMLTLPFFWRTGVSLLLFQFS